MFTQVCFNIYCTVFLVTDPDHPCDGGRCSAVGVFLLFISAALYSGGLTWPSAVVTEPWWDATEADSEDQSLYRESPGGLVRTPLMNSRHHYCHRKDGDNYLVYYAKAGFIQGRARDRWKQKAHLCLQESQIAGGRCTFPRLWGL